MNKIYAGISLYFTPVEYRGTLLSHSLKHVPRVIKNNLWSVLYFTIVLDIIYINELLKYRIVSSGATHSVRGLYIEISVAF